MGAAGPPTVDETPAFPWEDSEPSNAEGDPISEPESFSTSEARTANVPSWIDGIEGGTDPDLLSNFKFDSAQPEDSFPQVQIGELLDDDSILRPRTVPEEVNAKISAPFELPNSNGDQEYVPPQHDGPITIQSSHADTEQFRSVLEGLSGTQILSGDYDRSGDGSLSTNMEAVVEAEKEFDELLAEFAETPASEVHIEAPEAEFSPPPPEALHKVEEPEPHPFQAESVGWPPTLPTQDDEWDDKLELSE